MPSSVRYGQVTHTDGTEAGGAGQDIVPRPSCSNPSATLPSPIAFCMMDTAVHSGDDQIFLQHLRCTATSSFNVQRSVLELFRHCARTTITWPVHGGGVGELFGLFPLRTWVQAFQTFPILFNLW